MKISIIGTGAYGLSLAMMFNKKNKNICLWTKLESEYLELKENRTNEKVLPGFILPDNIEAVPKRFAIIFRNKWMIRQSDYVITYVTERMASGAAQFKELAERQGKNIINLYIK